MCFVLLKTVDYVVSFVLLFVVHGSIGLEFSPKINYSNAFLDEDRSLYVERSLDSIGGGNLIRSVNMNDLSDNLVHPRQHVRRSAMPEGFDNDWNLAAERRNSYRYAWPKYGSIHTNFRRALDSIGGGHLLKRTLDSIGGANLIRK